MNEGIALTVGPALGVAEGPALVDGSTEGCWDGDMLHEGILLG